MKPLALADLETALRVLLTRPEAEWDTTVCQMLEAAQKGAAYRAMTRRVHPRFGTGTLMSAAQRLRPGPRPKAYGRRERAALNAVLKQLELFDPCDVND